MANLKEIRTRVSSVITTRQITSAMKMVSAAKLRKSQDAIIQMRPYAQALQQILTDVAQNTESEELELFKAKREVKKALFILITSNKGLCGAFNSSISKKLISDLNESYPELWKSGNIDIYCIGKKGAEFLRSKNITASEINIELAEKPNYTEIRCLALNFIDQYLKGDYDLISIYYNQFKNAATQEAVAEQFLPFVLPEMDIMSERRYDYILEPSKERIISGMIPKSLKIKLFKALLDSNASEQGARMTAMHKATDNASELIRSLQLEYNKARQAAITNEILEIVGGAEALKG